MPAGSQVAQRGLDASPARSAATCDNYPLLPIQIHPYNLTSKLVGLRSGRQKAQFPPAERRPAGFS
ncbi:unnamed protein product, partial [Nesidiocoris tenuis]